MSDAENSFYQAVTAITKLLLQLFYYFESVKNIVTRESKLLAICNGVLEKHPNSDGDFFCPDKAKKI